MKYHSIKKGLAVILFGIILMSTILFSNNLIYAQSDHELNFSWRPVVTYFYENQTAEISFPIYEDPSIHIIEIKDEAGTSLALEDPKVTVDHNGTFVYQITYEPAISNTEDASPQQSYTTECSVVVDGLHVIPVSSQLRSDSTEHLLRSSNWGETATVHNFRPILSFQFHTGYPDLGINSKLYRENIPSTYPQPGQTSLLKIGIHNDYTFCNRIVQAPFYIRSSTVGGKPFAPDNWGYDFHQGYYPFNAPDRTETYTENIFNGNLDENGNLQTMTLDWSPLGQGSASVERPGSQANGSSWIQYYVKIPDDFATNPEYNVGKGYAVTVSLVLPDRVVERSLTVKVNIGDAPILYNSGHIYHTVNPEDHSDLTEEELLNGVTARLHDSPDLVSFAELTENVSKSYEIYNLDTGKPVSKIPKDRVGAYQIRFTLEDTRNGKSKELNRNVYIVDRHITEQNITLIANDSSVTTQELQDNADHLSNFIVEKTNAKAYYDDGNVVPVSADLKELTADSIIREAPYVVTLTATKGVESANMDVNIYVKKPAILESQIETTYEVLDEQGIPKFQVSEQAQADLKEYAMPDDTIRVHHTISNTSIENEEDITVPIQISATLAGDEIVGVDHSVYIYKNDNIAEKEAFGNSSLFLDDSNEITIPQSDVLHLIYDIVIPSDYQKNGDLSTILRLRQDEFQYKKIAKVAALPQVLYVQDIDVSTTKQSMPLTVEEIITQMKLTAYDATTPIEMTPDNYKEYMNYKCYTTDGTEVEVGSIDRLNTNAYIIQFEFFDSRALERLKQKGTRRIWISQQHKIDEINQVDILYEDITMNEFELNHETSEVLLITLRELSKVKAYDHTTMQEITNITVDSKELTTASPSSDVPYEISFLISKEDALIVATGNVRITPNVLSYISIPSSIQLRDGGAKVVNQGIDQSDDYVGIELEFSMLYDEQQSDIVSPYDFEIQGPSKITLNNSQTIDSIEAYLYDAQGNKMAESDDNLILTTLRPLDDHHTSCYLNIAKKDILVEGQYQGTLSIRIDPRKQ